MIDPSIVHPVVSFFTPSQTPTVWKVKFNHRISEIIKEGSTYFHLEGTLFTNSKLVLKSVNQGKSILCGSMTSPTTTKLLENATASSFGRGDEKIFDESVRKGRELCPDQIEVDIPPRGFPKSEIRQKLFPNAKDLKFVFSKLAIYEAGGHFDAHRDTVRSHDHQGTLLIEVRSTHTGGDLVLEQNGEEFRWSLASQPQSNHLRYIAFYTDVRHRVEPIESGVRMVLQYDIYVIAKDPPTKKRKRQDDENEDENDENGGDDDDNSDESEFDEDSVEDQEPEFDNFFEKTTSYSSSFSNNFPSLLLESLNNHVSDDKSISFPLFHLYTDLSLLPNRLKAIDHQILFLLLTHGYCVQLIPVAITAMSGYEGTWNDSTYEIQSLSTTNEGYVLQDQETVPKPITRYPKTITYIATGFEQVQILDRHAYSEYTGNEPSPATYRYFQSVFVVNTKRAVDEKKEEEKGDDGLEEKEG